jgi:hypothetical protein
MKIKTVPKIGSLDTMLGAIKGRIMVKLLAEGLAKILLSWVVV